MNQQVQRSNVPWIVGFLGTWFVLSAMSDMPALEDLANALAISVALGATMILGPSAFANIQTTR